MRYRPTLRLLPAAALFTVAAGCSPGQTDAPTAPTRAPTQGLPAADAPRRFHAEAAGGFAASVDDRGVPTFIWGVRRGHGPPPGSSHEQAARFHAARFATALALRPEALAAAEPARVLDHGDDGVIV